MKLSFSGTRVLLLGGSCDLAICLAGLLIEEGLHPILTWRSKEGRQRITERLERSESEFDTAYLNLADRKSVDALFAGLGDEFYSLVDFAQGDFEELIGSANPESIHRYFEENIAVRAEMIRHAARIMLRKKRGRMVFISSAAAVRSNPGQGFYAAAKLASEALYRNIGIELRSRGITTVTLRPGYIDAGRGARFLRAREGKPSTGQSGLSITCEEAADAILFFLSENARAFNATEIMMDGGFTATK